MSRPQSPRHSLSSTDLIPFLSHERMGSYLSASKNDQEQALLLYEWNMDAAASIMHLSSMVEVVVRNAVHSALSNWARRQGDPVWFDRLPLDQHGLTDLRKARKRATRDGKVTETPGKVVAELSFGFWRYLFEKRYLTSIWVPAMHAAFPRGAEDLRVRREDAQRLMQQLHFIRNRAAHHEPIHNRTLQEDLDAAIQISAWISPITSEWITSQEKVSRVLASRP